MGDVVSPIVEGIGSLQRGKFEEAEAKRAFKIAQIQADETSAALTQELNRTLGNINAALVSSQRDPTSPTAAALRREAIETSQEDQTRERTNILLRGFAQRRAGKFAGRMGTLGFVGGLARGSANAAKLALGAAAGGG